MAEQSKAVDLGKEDEAMNSLYLSSSHLWCEFKSLSRTVHKGTPVLFPLSVIELFLVFQALMAKRNRCLTFLTCVQPQAQSAYQSAHQLILVSLPCHYLVHSCYYHTIISLHRQYISSVLQNQVPRLDILKNNPTCCTILFLMKVIFQISEIGLL